MDQVETGSFASTQSGTKPPQSVRVVSWNLNRGCKLKQILEYLETADGDLILLQETDRNASRSGYRNVAKEIAEKLCMHYAFGCEFNELSQGSSNVPAHHGQATLSRWPLSNSRVMRFRMQSEFWRPRWYIPTMSLFQRRIGGRIALVSEVSVGQLRFVTYNLHLESRGNNDLRQQQLNEVLQNSRKFGEHGPVLIGGDFNFDLRHPLLAATLSEMEFENPFKDGASTTFTARSRFGSGRSIDFILTKGFSLLADAKVVNVVFASDHFPLTLTLKLN